MKDDRGIVVMEKPDDITFKDISELLQKAHEQHRKNGIVMRVPSLSPDELEKWVGDKGKCYVALLDGKLVGTSSIMIRKLNRWYHKGDVTEVTMVGVLPEYRGMHIATMLNEALEKEIIRSGNTAIYSDTAEENISRIRMTEKDGYTLVDFLFPNQRSKGHYSVAMMKWLDECPFSKRYCAFRFNMKRIMVKCIYTVFGKSIYRIRKLVKG